MAEKQQIQVTSPNIQVTRPKLARKEGPKNLMPLYPPAKGLLGVVYPSGPNEAKAPLQKAQRQLGKREVEGPIAKQKNKEAEKENQGSVYVNYNIVQKGIPSSKKRSRPEWMLHHKPHRVPLAEAGKDTEKEEQEEEQKEEGDEWNEEAERKQQELNLTIKKAFEECRYQGKKTQEGTEESPDKKGKEQKKGQTKEPQAKQKEEVQKENVKNPKDGCQESVPEKQMQMKRIHQELLAEMEQIPKDKPKSKQQEEGKEK